MTQITKPRGSPYKKSMREEPTIKKYKFKTFAALGSVEELKTPVKKPTDTSEICFVFYLTETERGLFVQCGDNTQIWLPISQLRNFPKNTYLKGSRISIDISHWLLRQDDKLKSLKVPVELNAKFIENEKPRVSIDVKLVAETDRAILVYDSISDLEHWLPKKVAKIEGKFNFRKNKKMNVSVYEWWAKKNLVSGYK